MQSKLILNALPCYAKDGVRLTNGICFAGFRAAQINDSDIPAAHLGAKQPPSAKDFAASGDGLSMLFASGKNDIVLVRSDPDRNVQEYLVARTRHLSEHLERCGFEPGSAVYVPEIESAIKSHVKDRFICPATFGTAMVKALDHDPQAVAHRHVIRTLMDKVEAYGIVKRLGADAALLKCVDDLRHAEDFLKGSSGPWVVKSAYGTGGQGFVVADTRSQFLAAWSRVAADWGRVFAAEAGENALLVASFTVDPHAAGPSAGLVAEMTVEMGRPKGLQWQDGVTHDAEVIRGAAEIARHHQEYAKSSGGALFTEVQDWGSGPPSFLGAAPRIGNLTSFAAYLACVPKRPARLKSLALPRGDISDAALFAKVKDFEATPERGEGLFLYSTGDNPYPHVLALAVNDERGDFENALRRLL
jgi:hypothetical protein